MKNKLVFTEVKGAGDLDGYTFLTPQMNIFKCGEYDIRSIGLISPSKPIGSIMLIKLLEEEALRHFPQMDAQARAEYVALSIEQANKPIDSDPEPAEQ